MPDEGGRAEEDQDPRKANDDRLQEEIDALRNPRSRVWPRIATCAGVGTGLITLAFLLSEISNNNTGPNGPQLPKAVVKHMPTRDIIKKLQATLPALEKFDEGHADKIRPDNLTAPAAHDIIERFRRIEFGAPMKDDKQEITNQLAMMVILFEKHHRPDNMNPEEYRKCTENLSSVLGGTRWMFEQGMGNAAQAAK